MSKMITTFADYEPEAEIHIPDSDGTCCEVVECIDDFIDDTDLGDQLDALRAAEKDEAYFNLLLTPEDEWPLSR